MNQVQYHSRRAIRELDLGLGASTIAAAKAHIRLSSLHLEKLHALIGDDRASPPPSPL